jgi:hypothetical protein
MQPKIIFKGFRPARRQRNPQMGYRREANSPYPIRCRATRCNSMLRPPAANRRIKKKCVAKHRGNALVALPEPLACNPLQERYGTLKKSSA